MGTEQRPVGTDELASYAERARATVADATDLGHRTTQLRLVEPFLERLGWDVRSPAVEAAFAVPEVDATVDYALLVDGEPAVFVDALACETALDPAHGDALLSAMAAAGVEWGILTNGRQFAFVARTEDGEDGFTCSLADLPDHAADLERFTPERATEYVHQRGDRRLAAAEAIADRRAELAAAFVDDLLAVAGDDAEAVPRDRLRPVADSFLDDALAAVVPEDHEPPGPDAEATDGRTGPDTDGETDADDEAATATEAGSAGTATAPDRPVTDSTGATHDAGARSVDAAGEATADSPDEPEHDVEGATRATPTEDGEYVARLFDGSSSICAVGGSSVVGTMKGTVDYLAEHHHLDAGLSLPYVPDDGGYAVLNRVPRHPNGEPMAEYVRLDSGPYLWTEGPLSARRERLQTLVREAGLRVMFQGDWKPE